MVHANGVDWCGRAPVGGGEYGRERGDLRVDRGDEQGASVTGGHEQIQAPLPSCPQGMVLSAEAEVDADAGGGRGGVEGSRPAVATFGFSQPVLCGDELWQPRGEQGRWVVAGGVGRADPVTVPGAEVIVVGEQPPYRACLVPGGAAGTGALGEVAQRWPVRRRHP